MRVESAAQSAGLTTPEQSLSGTSDFMTLLVAQLQAQDPMSPMDPSEFMSQLAQLQSVSELQTISGLLGERADGAVADAVSLIGRTVQWLDPETGGLQEGAVDRVSITDGDCRVVVGSAELSLEDVRSVSN